MGNGKLLELRLESSGQVGGRLACPAALRPQAGQYLLADNPAEPEPLPVTLFPSGRAGEDLLVAPPLPPAWAAGATLTLRGPLGKGFSMPQVVRRAALAGLDDSVQRLLPLVHQALQQGADVALYCDRPVPPELPLAVEVLPLGQLAQALSWADYLALDLPAARLPDLWGLLGLEGGRRCPCPAEALVLAPMPCGGLASCGVCAVYTSNGWRLSCKDGPVFRLDILKR